MTDFQKHVYEAIIEHWRDYQIPPTLRDILTATQTKSTSSVRYAYYALQDFGLIAISKTKPVPAFLQTVLKEPFQ